MEIKNKLAKIRFMVISLKSGAWFRV